MTEKSTADDFDPDVPMFSRSGTSALGKCEFPIKTMVPEQTFLSFRAMASEAGCTVSELLRDLVCLAVHSKTFGEITADERRTLLKRQGPE